MSDQHLKEDNIMERINWRKVEDQIQKIRKKEERKEISEKEASQRIDAVVKASKRNFNF